mmetsp:Transcript_17177/g.36374  ORF Transcript_17177/g.36374 Transcript_17177/m.36374 type:complete len:149 (-) Transcript_17177:116-562(-)
MGTADASAEIRPRRSCAISTALSSASAGVIASSSSSLSISALSHGAATPLARSLFSSFSTSVATDAKLSALAACPSHIGPHPSSSRPSTSRNCSTQSLVAARRYAMLVAASGWRGGRARRMSQRFVCHDDTQHRAPDERSFRERTNLP